MSWALLHTFIYFKLHYILYYLLGNENFINETGSDDEGSLGGDQEAANRDTGATGVGSDSGGSLVDMASVENLPPGSFR